MKEMYTEPSFELIKVLGTADVITMSGEDWDEESGNNPFGPNQGQG